MVNKKLNNKQQQEGVSFNLKPTTAAVRLALTGMLASSIFSPVQAELPLHGVVEASKWVSSGAASKLTQGNRMDITQTTNKVVLNWQKFNIGINEQVNFAQPGASSVALNRIGQNDPSRILGKLTANGQIYLINQNGFIFGENSVVNVNSLIATTHNISDSVFERGITRVFDDTGEAAFILDSQIAEANQAELKKILVNSGAKITADDTGRIILIAPKVENKGSLEVGKQGQIMLVASQDKVYLQQANAEAEGFAGLLVEVDTGGDVTNFGDILAKQGNITMAGFAVNQQGRVNATTSVTVNGSIRLQAREGHSRIGTKLVGKSTSRENSLADGLGTKATLRFAEGSSTNITLDDSKGNVIDEQAQADSFLEFSAHDIEFKTGSKVVAPGAKLVITATDRLTDPLQGTQGRISIEDGSVIDVSGVRGVKVAMERNVADVNVKSNELRNSPKQRNSILSNAIVSVDVRNTTEIIDTSAATNSIKRSVFERMAQGGDISMTASGQVDVQKGALINIAGGSVEYLGGNIETTYLINEFGQMIGISDANPDEKYIGITKQKYFEQAYREGKDAGTFTVKTADFQWKGNLDASVINGRKQRSIETMARGGAFSIDMAIFNATKNIAFNQGNAFSRLTTSGLQDFSLKTWGDVSIANDVSLALKPFTNITIEAGGLDVRGGIYTASGDIHLTAMRNGALKTRGELVLGRDAVLDVSGRWVNDRVTADQGINPTEAVAINGGTVALSAEGDLITTKASTIRANGGAWLTTDAKVKAGKGGDITLQAIGNGATPSLLFLNASLSAQALTENGTLTLASNKFVIADKNSTDVASKTNFIDANNSIFSEFSSISLNALFDNIELQDHANINLTQRNRQFQSNYLSSASNNTLDNISTMVTLPLYLRNTASQLNLTAKNTISMAYGSSIFSEAGSAISLQAENSIFVDGIISAPAGSIDIKIKASNGKDFISNQTLWLGKHAQLLARGAVKLNADPVFRTGDVLNGGDISLITERGYLVMEQGSTLDVSGTAATLDMAINGVPSFGYQSTGIGSDAGAIKLVAAEGMLLEGKITGIAGSAINKAGSLSVELDRSNRNLPEDPGIPFPVNPLKIIVSQNLAQNFTSAHTFGDVLDPLLTGQVNVSANGLIQGGFDFIQFTTPDSIQFKGDVNLSAGIAIKLDASSIEGLAQAGQTNPVVNLDATYLALGSSKNRQVQGQTVAGDAKLNVNGQWVELFGAIKLDGFGQVNIASKNDIQLKGNQFGEQRDFLGELITAADLTLTASKIYPTSLTEYKIAVENRPEGRINIIASNGNTAVPLTAGGKLSIQAAHIRQAGTLLAPLGHIKLQASKSLELADGSVTSVSAKGLLVPLGIVQGGLDWLYPLDSVRNLVFDSTQEKRVVFDAPEIDQAQGSVVDLSGGGDLFAYEFMPGAGGSFDYLQTGSPSNQGSFAVLPTLGSSFAPFDFFQSKGSPFKVGEVVYLNGGGGLAAGQYVKLPAHYALLPGAFLVTPKAGTQDQGFNSHTLDGRTIVSGYSGIAGSGKREARKSGFMIENGGQVRQQSQYQTYTGNEFFVKRSLENETVFPVLAKDSGIISIQAQTKLRLNGLFKVDAEGNGRGARMDIAANIISVTNSLSNQQQQGVLEILASDLSNLNIASLLLGGERQAGNKTAETVINVGSENITFEKDAVLDVNDLIVAAKNSIVVAKGATVSATGDVNTGDKLLTVGGDGALLRVSGSEQVDLNRVSSTGQKGKLIVEDGAILQAKKSMLLESSQSTEIAGKIIMNGGSLNLAANSINIGEVSGLAKNNALNLSNADLTHMAVDELVLTSRDTVNFYGSTGLVDANNIFQSVTGGISPVEISKLVINAAGLSGFSTQQAGSNSDSVNLKVKQLELKNTLDMIAALPATGAGKLNVEADNISLGDGTFTVSGFNSVNLTANKQFKANGIGKLRVDADLNVTANLVTASSKSDYQVDASGHNVDFLSKGSRSAQITQGLTGKLDIKADQITINTHIAMTSGQFGLHALTQGVILGKQAFVDLSGTEFNFADVTKITSGGSLNVIADHGSISFLQGSSVNLNGGDNQQLGGTLNLKATEGNAVLNGVITAQEGSANIDVAGFQQVEALSGFINKLSDAGINNKIDYRSREQSIKIAANTEVKAQQLKFTADKGDVVIAGQLIADAKEGSKIELFAADQVILTDGAKLSAKTLSTQQGGKVLLSSTDSDHDGLSGIDIQSGSSIDVADATGKHGEVVLRALRTDSDGNGLDDSINITQLAGNVTGYAGRTISKTENGSVVNYKEGNRFYAEGVKIYQDSNGFITSADINQYKTDANLYMSNNNRLKVNSDLQQDLQLRPGVEVQYDGNLRLNSDLNTVAWRYASLLDGINSNGVEEKYDATVGQLALRASGDLLLNKSISDGFKDGVIKVETVIEFFGQFFPISESIQVKDKLQSGNSWSFNLVAGADLASSDTTAVKEAGNITIASNVKVRTGSGDIRLTSAGDVNFTSQSSVLYNAGRPDVISPYGSLSDTIVGFNFYSEYPVSGGDIDIKAGGDIKGAKSTQFINNWLLRQGSWSNGSDHTNEVPTSWGVALGYTPNKFTNAAFSRKPLFEQNIGSFGGGNVTIVAQGNISDLSVMMPTTGKQVGTPDPNSPLGFLTNQVEINGGGNMRVIAGGDIAGGAFVLGRGQAELIAGGSIKGGKQFTDGPLLALGDSQFKIQAEDDINLSSVTDPMILGKANDKTSFFSYSDRSSLDISSAAGDILLGADDSVVKKILRYGTPQSTLAKIYPASLNAVALGGSVLLKDQIILFPSAKGNLNLLAKNNIASEKGNLRLGMSDVDRTLLPSALLPVKGTEMIESGGRLNPFGRGKLVHALTPLHTEDDNPVRFVTKEGNIGQLQINVAKKAIVKAGNDISNVALQVQQVNSSDSSLIEAGRDIKFTSERDPGTGALLRNLSKIEVAGPGDVLIKTGRDVDLGASDGITSVGDTFNAALANSGANITILAGAAKDPDYIDFIKQMKLFKQNYSGNNIELEQFFTEVEKLGDNELLAMNSTALNKTIMPLFYKSLKIAATALAKNNAKEGDLGNQAITALFPGSDWNGNLKLFFSKIQTVDGGNINMAVPGGGINAGLAVAFSGAKSSSELGIVAQREGEVNAYLRDDFMVNQSRIFTLSGGDILAWTSEGNIDAGRGARSAIAAPPPIISFDEDGNLVIEFPPIVSGSGIRAVASGEQQAGNVFLVAQKGFIDAGEAGIAGNDFVGVADKFLNNSGLEFSGATSGVPVASASAPPVTGLTNTNASVSKAAEKSVQNNSDEGDEKQIALGMLSVDVVGFGSEDGKEACQKTKGQGKGACNS